MQVVKIRRVGNSNVVTLPHHLEAFGYTPGTSVVVDKTADGALLILPESKARDRIRSLGRKIISEHREALDLLEAHDRGDAEYIAGELRRR